tara:strand:+ start:3321 stop:4040 length:720 start_codon:yes stop_codon:yes gene_type:complete
MSSYDVAICYFGLPRSISYVYNSHQKYIYDILDSKGFTYKKFMHSWKTNEGKQRVWRYNVKEKINYDEYKLFNPDVYVIESQDDFIDTINMSDYYYENENEWDKTLLKNHICALGSENRVYEIMKNSGDTFKYVIVIRPDSEFLLPLPINNIFPLQDNEFVICNNRHYQGYNDRFMISNINSSHIYLTRLKEMKEGRKECGYITAEKYLKYTFQKHNSKIKEIKFPFNLIRPDGSKSNT